MDLFSGQPYWLIRTGLPFDYPALESSIKTDVVIMGGGISGALMGYHLVNAGVDCVVVDARTIGLGSTCASTSLILYEIDTMMTDLMPTTGPANAVEAYKISEATVHQLGQIAREIGFNDFQFKKSLYFAASSDHVEKLKKEFKARKAAGFGVQYLDEAAIKEIYGFDAYGAILTDVAAQTNAYAFTHALHQAAIKKGLRVFDRTNVNRIEHQDQGVLLHTEKGCTITAGKLVYANGYEAVNHIDKKIVDLYSTYVTMSEPLSSSIQLWKDETLLWNTADPYLYIRTTTDRRIAVGGRDKVFRDITKQDKRIPEKARQLKKDFDQLFPGIEFKPEFNWTGVFGTTTEGLPYIGTYKNKPNSYFALGFGGNGISFSLIAAEVITALIVKGKHEHEKLFAFERDWKS